MTEQITVQITITAPLEKVWKCYTEPEHITKWAMASDDWHAPTATNDLKPGGKFSTRMEAKDGSAGFDFEGVYDEVIPLERINYTMTDGRKVATVFKSDGANTTVMTSFDAENENPIEMQKGGWQSILDNLKKHVESH
jgi:uncharacterized protein YndB with AHSA1/START domain